MTNRRQADGELTYAIPGRGTLHLSILVLDLNGTVTIDGQIIPGVAERIASLKSCGMVCYLLTGDTRGTGAKIADALGLRLQRLVRGHEREQKRAYVEQWGADRIVAIGNGANDAGMLQAASLGIAVAQPEGLSVASLLAADVVVPDICTALDLLLKPKRLIATTRL